MSTINCFTSARKRLRLLNENRKVLFLGLDNAGKTTLVHLLKYNQILSHMRYMRTTEDVTIENTRLTCIDLGSSRADQKMCKTYISLVDGIVFIIDSSDRTRFSESKQELYKVLLDDWSSFCPILVIGNKIDKRGAADEGEIVEYYGLHGQTTGKKCRVNTEVAERPVELFMCSVLQRSGFSDAISWLLKKL